MKRFAFLAAAAALLGTGCGTSTPTPLPPNTAIDFSWRFDRYVYDTNSSISYGCAQAQVDNVVVSFDVGGDVVVPCADNAGDGARITGVEPGSRSVVVTGRRGSAELFQTQPFTVDVVLDQVETTPVIGVAGIPDNLAVYANFVGRLGQDVGWRYCADPDVQTITYKIVDVADTVIAHGSVDCIDPTPPGVSFTGQYALDRDNYAIRMRAWRTGTATAILDSASTVAPANYTCNGQAFNHFGPNDAWDVLLYDVTQNSTVCP